MPIENANKAPALSFALLLIACAIASAISAVRILQDSNPLGLFAIFNASLPYAFVASFGIGLYAVSWATDNAAAKNAATVAMVVLGVGCLAFSVLA
jgi:undecaprenyl pyrophosphate phosphatase UppP